jgi:FkbM family methyltransferase
MQSSVSLDTKIEELNGFKFRYFTKDIMSSGCVGINKEWEPHITKFVKIYNSLYSIQNIIDIGANFGYHSLLFSKETKGNVYSFEPQIQNFKLLENNINLNKISNIIPYNFACGDEECDVKMPVITNDFNNINMGDITPNFLISKAFSCTKSIIIDNMNFSQIDLIKIDVQGWEKKVLLGSLSLIKKNKPILIVEFEEFQLKKTQTTCEELFKFIRDMDYYIFFLDYSYPSDHVCVHKSKLDDFRNKFKDYIFIHNENNNVNQNLKYNVCEKISV